MNYDSLEQSLTDGMNCAYWAQHTPEVPALILADGRRISFREFNGRINRFARALRGLGLQDGDSIALISPNRPEWAEVYFGAIRSGLRVTPINFHLRPDEASYIIDDCEAKAVVVGGIPKETEPLLGALPDRVEVTVSLDHDEPGVFEYRSIVSRESPDDLEDPVLGGWMIYTSGTTGRPKGVYRSDRAAAAAGRNRASREGIFGSLRPGADVHLCTGPLYHSAINNMSLHVPLTSGVTVVLMERFDAEECLRLIETHRVTHTHMVPTMFHRLLQLPEETRRRYDLSSLRQIVHGAAPCPVSVKRAMIDWVGPIILEYFGMTEGGAGTHIDSETWLVKPGSVGLPTPGTLVIGDEEMRPMGPGEPGLVYVLAPGGRRFEYYNDQEKTEATFRGDLFTLGDVGYLDEDGFLFLTDRSANLIISGGVNIYPAEVDEVLFQHPAVADVATIGVPNEEWGEEVKAVLQLVPGRTGSAELEAELLSFCRDRLAHYKCPKSVDFVRELPRQDNGKIYKRVLREQYRREGEEMGGGTRRAVD
jgi:long-chain acyl-CoA synthetase